MDMSRTASPKKASSLFAIILIGLLTLMIASTGTAYAAGGEEDVKAGVQSGAQSEDTEEDSAAASIIETITSAPIGETITQVADEGENAYYELKLGGVTFAAFETEKEARDVIEVIDEHFAHSDVEGAVITMEPELTVEKVWLDPASSDKPALEEDINKVITALVKGDTEGTVYFTGPDDTLWDVAEAYGLEVDDLLELNSGLDPEVITEGTRIVVREPEPLVKVKVEYDELVEKKIKHKSVEEETDELYEGETLVSQEGYDGLALATEHVTLINGKETGRKETDREIIEEAVDEITLVGVAERPAEVEPAAETYEEPVYEEENYEDEASESFAEALTSAASAVNSAPVSSTGFIWPLSGTVTYGFGYRSAPAYGASSYHQGIDICAAYGTPIVAAASGTTTGLTGWYDGYGLAVVIDHGNGLVTVYGHCSSLAVSSGQYVEQGQVIGYVGSTGISSANHCHFEVRANGTAVDPYNYL